MTNQTAHLRMFCRMLKAGMDAQLARDYLAQDIKCCPSLVKMYRHWSGTKNGKKILGELTLQWRSYGVEPPFADIIDMRQVLHQSPVTA